MIYQSVAFVQGVIPEKILLLRTNGLLLDRELMGGSSRHREKDDKALEQKSIEALVDVDPSIWLEHRVQTRG